MTGDARLVLRWLALRGAPDGRLVKTTGDGLMVEFGSVVEALQCATEVQAGRAERNTAVPNDWCIEFRIA